MMIVGISVTTAAIGKDETEGIKIPQNSTKDGQTFSPVNGKLKIYVKYARELRDTDGPFNLPDPYVVVDAYDTRLHKNTRKTITINETLNPDWNEWLEFGKEDWLEFRIQLLDADKYWDDEMMPPDTVSICQGNHKDQTYSSEDNGYLMYDYILE
ncbi:Bone morphogenetic protein 1 [Oopsacas minuta]|uniref:Bone morphogenetic protein 1 n=1 Tax=Oopsacas minuta TaxID=111878 RepID=A0AAV7JKX6_9METZ|nr:Bone morphogenetic protein 1 [Oopsacas minuta]